MCGVGAMREADSSSPQILSFLPHEPLSQIKSNQLRSSQAEGSATVDTGVCAGNRREGAKLNETCSSSASSSRMADPASSRLPGVTRRVARPAAGSSTLDGRGHGLGGRLQGWVRGVWKRRAAETLCNPPASPRVRSKAKAISSFRSSTESQRMSSALNLPTSNDIVAGGIDSSLERAGTLMDFAMSPSQRARGNRGEAGVRSGASDNHSCHRRARVGVAEPSGKIPATQGANEPLDATVSDTCLNLPSDSAAVFAYNDWNARSSPRREDLLPGSRTRHPAASTVGFEGGGTGDSAVLHGGTCNISRSDARYTRNLRIDTQIGEQEVLGQEAFAAATGPLSPQCMQWACRDCFERPQNLRQDQKTCRDAGSEESGSHGDGTMRAALPRCAISSNSDVVGNDYYWTPINVSLAPAGRAAHSGDSTWDGKKMFVFGGWMGKKTLDGLHIYDSELQLWLPPVRLLEAPVGRNNHATAVVGHRIYMHGGHDGSHWLDDLHVLDTELVTWRELETFGERPCPRACHSLSQVNSRLYLFGGYNGVCCFNDMTVFDIETLTWAPVLPSLSGQMPRPRNAHSMTAVDGKLVLFGGHDGTTHLDDLFIFDVHSLTWSELSRDLLTGRMPPPLRGHSGTLVPPNRLLVFGGFDGKRRRNDIFILNLRSNTWRHYPESASSPPCRQRHSACLVGSKLIYIFGGFNGTRWLNDLYALDSMQIVDQEDVLDTSTKSLLRDLGSLVGSSAFADVCIIAEGKNIPAHRNILALRSEYFRSMFSTPMLESRHQCVKIVGWRYSTVISLLEYIYTGNVTEHDFDALCDLLGLADSVSLEPLKSFCSQLLRRQTNSTNVCRLLGRADRCQATDLLNYCQQYILDHGSSIALSSDLDMLTKSPQLLCDIAKLSLQCRSGRHLASSPATPQTIDGCDVEADCGSNMSEERRGEASNPVSRFEARAVEGASLRRVSSSGGSVEMDRMQSIPFTSSFGTSSPSCRGNDAGDESCFL